LATLHKASKARALFPKYFQQRGRGNYQRYGDGHDTLPSGLSLASMAGTVGAALQTSARSDALAGASSYPAIAVTVNVLEPQCRRNEIKRPFLGRVGHGERRRLHYR